jgi:hypothetical protein
MLETSSGAGGAGRDNRGAGGMVEAGPDYLVHHKNINVGFGPDLEMCDHFSADLAVQVVCDAGLSGRVKLPCSACHAPKLRAMIPFR